MPAHGAWLEGEYGSILAPNPNLSLGHETPLDLIADGRHERVADVLNGLAEGVTA